MPGRSQNVNTNFSQAFAVAAYTDPIPTHDALLVTFDQGSYNAATPATFGKTGAVEVYFYSKDASYNQNMDLVDAGVGPIVLHLSAGATSDPQAGEGVNETATKILPYRAKALGGVTGCSVFGLIV